MAITRVSEEIRIRYKYRDLILRGKVRLPLEAAKKMVGPDCAYHLYSVSELTDDNNKPPKKKR